MGSELIIHCGGRTISREELATLEAPPPSERYRPFDFIDIVSMVEKQVNREFPGVGYDLGFGVNKAGTQLFGALSLKKHGPFDKRTPTVGFRSSYDQSIAPALCGGMKVTVCDNLMFCGELFKIMRKQTSNKAWDDLKLMALGAIATMKDHIEGIELECESYEDVEVGLHEGYRQIGELMGTKVLNQQQGGEAMRQWRAPMYEEFSDRTAWSLYNAMTQALKKGAPITLMKQYTQVNTFMRDRYLKDASNQLAIAQ